MLIYQVNHIAIHYPESWDECRLFDFRIEPYSRYGQCLLVFDTHTEWGYFLKSDFGEVHEGNKGWYYYALKRNDPSYTLYDYQTTCIEISERIGMDIRLFMEFPLRILKKKLNEGCNDANFHKMLGDIYWKEDAFLDAINHYTIASNKGSIDAMYELAEIYADKKSEFYQIEEALRWYEEAAKQGHEPSIFSLGAYYYELGNEEQKALSYLEKLSFNYAAYEFGICLGVRYSDKEIGINVPIMLEYLYWKLGETEKSNFYTKILEEYILDNDIDVSMYNK